MTSVQRKQGVGFFKPVSWNKGRRFTSPGPPGNNHRTQEFISHEGPLLQLQIEAYLDDHPEFMESYVLRKVDRSTIDKWMVNNALMGSEDRLPPRVKIDNVVTPDRKESENSYLRQRKGQRLSSTVRTHYSADCTPVMRRSQSVTPHRKISAANFEGGCHSPLLTTAEDGSVSFLTVPLWTHGGSKSRPELQRISSQQENETNSNLPDIQDDLTSDLNHASLSVKIGRNLCLISKAKAVSVLQVKRTGQRIQLQAAALNVQTDSKDSDCLGHTMDLSSELTNILVQLARENRAETFSRMELEKRWGAGPPFLEETTEQVTVMPLPSVEGQSEGLAMFCLGSDSLQDVETNRAVRDICKLSGICLKNAADFHSVRLEVTRSQVFLDLARVIFDQETSVEFTVLKILVNFLNLIECERAQVLLSSKESPNTFHKVFDLAETDLIDEHFEDRKKPYENRFPINSAITGLVATLGETVNIGDVSSDGRFDPNIDSDAHFEHRSLLCMPIRDSDNSIIGVVSLINKKSGCFSSNDESFVEAFGVFCGISLANVSNFESVKTAEARSQVALDIMSYHASSDPEEAESLAMLPVPSSLTLHLRDFSFTDTEMEDIDTLKASLRMFHDLDLVKRFNLDTNTLCRWLLTVKKNYRPEVVYHNWRHAFNVAQVMFSSILTSGWWEGLGPVTCLGLLIACLCHDLDHRGTNNTYQLATNSPLARLYSTSTLERHHLNQTLVILSLEGNTILQNLTTTEYNTTLAVIEEAILATDLSQHFAHLGKLMGLAQLGPSGLDWTDESVVSITTAALMTGADLGATTKPWAFQQEVAGLVAEEFWSQGDLERSQLATQPAPMMDREMGHQLPRLQVGFCESVCLPVYRALASLSPSLRPLEEAVASNRDRWCELAESEPCEESKVTRNL